MSRLIFLHFLVSQLNDSLFSVSSAACGQCTSQGFAKVTGPNGYIASADSNAAEYPTGCGTTRCPWAIQVKTGQKINLTLYDFTLNTAISPYRYEQL